MNLRMMCSTPLKLRAVSNPTARASHARISRREWSALVPRMDHAGSNQPSTPTRKSSEHRVEVVGFAGAKCRNEVPWKAATCPTRAFSGA